jgi:polar amino acid transport system ATP-binding protein
MRRRWLVSFSTRDCTMTMTSSNAVPLVRIDALHKQFGSNRVLRGVSLDVQAGQKVALIGPSGSGKTTLLRCINYLEEPTSGHVYLNGELVGERRTAKGFARSSARELARIRQRIGMVFQRFNLFEHLSVLENITLGPVKALGQSRDEADVRARELLRRVGMDHKEHAYPAQLSGGQQQRVAIARALAMNPEVMLFDEATSALDPELVKGILEIMRDLAASGMTMVVVTHELRFAREAATQVVFLDEGRLIEQGPPERLFEAPESPRLRHFLAQML